VASIHRNLWLAGAPAHQLGYRALSPLAWPAHVDGLITPWQAALLPKETIVNRQYGYVKLANVGEGSNEENAGGHCRNPCQVSCHKLHHAIMLCNAVILNSDHQRHGLSPAGCAISASLSCLIHPFGMYELHECISLGFNYGQEFKEGRCHGRPSGLQ
jgi:hypothetical protein